MTLSELAKAARAKNDPAFGNIHDNRVDAIVHEVLGELLKEIEKTEEGEIELTGFGKFIIKKIPVKTPDQKTVQRRIIFRTEQQPNKPTR